MTPTSIGIDTSVLVRLVTGQPPDLYSHCVEQLNALVAAGAKIFASNQVIGEAYIALQLHYGATKEDARADLGDVLESGLVEPLNGCVIIEALQSTGGPGLIDRLIADDYSRTGMDTLTLDRRMASLPGVQPL